MHPQSRRRAGELDRVDLRRFRIHVDQRFAGEVDDGDRAAGGIRDGLRQRRQLAKLDEQPRPIGCHPLHVRIAVGISEHGEVEYVGSDSRLRIDPVQVRRAGARDVGPGPCHAENVSRGRALAD